MSLIHQLDSVRYTRPRVGGTGDGAIPYPSVGQRPRGEEEGTSWSGLVHTPSRQPRRV